MSARRSHPTPDRLAAFVAGADDAGDCARIRRHLLQPPCLHCLLEAHRALVAARPVPGEEALYELRHQGPGSLRRAALAKAARRVERLAFLYQVERALAPELAGELLRLPEESRRQATRLGARYHLVALVEYLADQSLDSVFESRTRAVSLGRLAVTLTEQLEPVRYGETEVARAMSRAWAAFGNARRVASDLWGAEAALSWASGLVDVAHPQPEDRGEILRLLGSLRIAQGREAEAELLLTEPIEGFRRGQSEPEVAKTRVVLAKCLAESGRSEESLDVLDQVKGELDPSASTNLLLIARHMRCFSFAECGRIDEARTLLEDVRGRWQTTFLASESRQRIVWLEAGIDWAFGEVAKAEARLLPIRASFDEREHLHDLGLVTWELIGFYKSMGRVQEARRMAAECRRIFESLRVARIAGETQLDLLRSS